MGGRGRWGAWTLGKLKQPRAYSQLEAPICSFPNLGSIVPDRNSVRAVDEERCQRTTVGWGRPFDDPITLPDGRELATLRDAGLYIPGLPKAVHDRPEWQAAAEALLLVAERGGPVMFAAIGTRRALNAGRPAPEAVPRRKPAKVYRVVR